MAKVKVLPTTTTTVNLGDEVECQVTGFKGIATGRSEFLHGCTRIGVQGRVNKSDGKVGDTYWFDEPQLTVKTRAKIKTGRRDTGGPVPSTPMRASNPRR